MASLIVICFVDSIIIVYIEGGWYFCNGPTVKAQQRQEMEECIRATHKHKRYYHAT